MTREEIYEYRGISDLVYAEVTADTGEDYTTGEVKHLAGIAKLAKKTESKPNTKFYDNVAAINNVSEGKDEFSLQTSVLPEKVLADILGKVHENELGMYVDTPIVTKYFAIGYKTMDSRGKEKFVWRHKGTFGIPTEDIETETDESEGIGQELVFTGIYTKHKFTTSDGKKAIKGIVVDAEGPADVTTFFDTVNTPETIKKVAVV